MGDAALLNAILRIQFSPSNFNNLTNPAPAPPFEIDHFWEVQHVVALIIPVLGPNWYPLAIGEFIDLSTFVNDHRNMFRINRDDNQRKKAIALARYPTDGFIGAYRRRDLQNGGTVEQSVKELAEAMRDRVSRYPRLTKHVGTELCKLMGW